MIIIIGAIFCQVKRINLLFQFNPSITWGNQKWKGAAPIFIKRDELINIKFTISELVINLKLFIKVIENKRIIEAIACEIKYLIDVSDLKIFFILIIIGIKDNKLISKPIHILSQE